MDFPDFSGLEKGAIRFYTEEVSYDLPRPEATAKWVRSVVSREQKQVQFLNFIFCSDAYLQRINIQYLNHDTLTDVIAFPYSDKGAPIEGDIYISFDRVQENANKFNVSFLQELKRVMLHGVLHLCGYKDKSRKEEKEMRAKEDFYLKE